MDYYLDFERFYNRLRHEYQKYGCLIIALDYDDTIFNTYNRKDATYTQVINTLRRWNRHSKVIVWSCSLPERYGLMMEYMNDLNLRCDAINENVTPIKYDHLNQCRKIYANVYIDDRAGLHWPIAALNRLMDEIEVGEIV